MFLVELYEIGQENISCKNRMKVEYARGETQANRRKSHFCIEKSLLAKGTVGYRDSCERRIGRRQSKGGACYGTSILIP